MWGKLSFPCVVYDQYDYISAGLFGVIDDPTNKAANVVLQPCELPRALRFRSILLSTGLTC